MIIDSKHELLMILIGLENSSGLILDHERAEDWHQRSFMSLYNRVAEEYNQYVEDEESAMVALLAEGYAEL
jgi:hypothetical protein